MFAKMGLFLIDFGFLGGIFVSELEWACSSGVNVPLNK